MTGLHYAPSRSLLCILMLASMAAISPAATITIRADGTGDYWTIGDAIFFANPGDEIVLEPGIHRGCTDYMGKAITIRSKDPDDPAVVAATGIWDGIDISFYSQEGRDSVLEGVTLYGGRDCIGVAIGGASPTIRNCVFDGSDFGVRICFGDPLIQNCTFRNIRGSAIQVWEAGSPTIDACTIRNGGHAIDCQGYEGLSATVSRCAFINNHGPYGQVVALSGGDLTIRDSLIWNNTNPDWPIAGCTFSLNGGSVTIEGCTIAGNSGGFYRAPDGQTYEPHGPLILRNTILWANPGGPLLPDPAASAAPVDVSYSIVEGGCPGTGVLDVDPLLLPNGRLSPGSPCVNAGDPAFVPAAGAIDLDGHPRVLDGRVDIGADELTHPGDVDGDGAVDTADLLAMVAAWGMAPGEKGYDVRSDLNRDGSVDVIDLLILLENWGQ